MASNFEILASARVSEYVSPTVSQDVLEVTARALPSGIVFYVRFPPVIDDPVNIAEITGTWAGWLNELNATPGVVSVSWIQDIDASDQIRDRLSVTIDSTDGRMQFTRDDIPLSDSVAQWQAAVAKTRAQLDAIEAQ